MMKLKGGRKQINISVGTHRRLKWLSFKTDIPMQILADEMLNKILGDEDLEADLVRMIREKYKIFNEPSG